MKEQPPNQASGASETTRLFCTRISLARDGAFPVEGIQPAPTGETNHEPEISKHGAPTFRRPNRSIRRRRERWERVMDDENSVRNNSLASDETVNQ